MLDVAALVAESVTKGVAILKQTRKLTYWNLTHAGSIIMLLTRHSVMYRLDISRILKTTISREPYPVEEKIRRYY